MNVVFIILSVLIVLAALLFLALRALKRGTDKGHCTGCNEQGCSGHPQDGACPSVSKALDDIDRKLGPRTEHVVRPGEKE